MIIINIICSIILIITFFIGDLLDNKFKIKNHTIYYFLGATSFIFYLILSGLIFLIKEF